jgi:SET domain-containing protein
MSIASYISPKAIKGVDSHIQGRGLMASAPFARGEIVAIKGGHIIDSEALNHAGEETRNSEIQIADGFHISALTSEEYEDVMLFLNHSCEPNVGVAGNIVFVAMRDIAAGEELTTDYALFDDHDAEMVCHCQRPGCRGVISGRDWQRRELQDRYGPYFSWYLKEKIKAASAGARRVVA